MMSKARHGVHKDAVLSRKHGIKDVAARNNASAATLQETRCFQHWPRLDPVVIGVFCTFSLGNVLRATTAYTFSTSQLPKVVRTWCVLYIFTWKCVSRHNSVHFFIISTSKSAPKLRCFVHFDLEMYFAPQRRVIFHLSSSQLAPHPPL